MLVEGTSLVELTLAAAPPVGAPSALSAFPLPGEDLGQGAS